MKLEQVLHRADVELTIRATGQSRESVIDRVQLIAAITDKVTEVFHQRFEPFDRRYDRSTPATVVAVMVGPIGIRCRIFSTDGKRLAELFELLKYIESCMTIDDRNR
jgi:hypothetical protein